ncbi:MAG: nucleoid-associated protein, partial [Nitrososphaerales archaeon]
MIQLKIQRMIFHDVPHRRRGSGDPGPTLSEIESSIEPQFAAFMRDRIVKNVQSSHAFEVVFDPESQSPLPGMLRKLTTGSGRDHFVETSQKMASHLFNMQDGTNPAGLLAVVDVSVNQHSALGIIKIEREEGGRLVPDVTKEGKRTFSTTVLNDLILTEGTKIFKNALFIRTGAGEDDFDAAVCDNQTRVGGEIEVAQFFLARFLGCKLIEQPQVTTKRYFEAVSDFINERIEDPEQKYECYNHLFSQLTSQTGTTSPKKFKSDCLPPDLRGAFTEYLKERKLPLSTFPLDTSLINAQLKRKLIHTKSDIMVSVPSKGAEDHIT